MILSYRHYYVLLAIWSQTLFSSPIEYLYPVAFNQLQNALYLIYQKSPESIELWFWNPQTHEAVPGLLSRFTPAGIRILPSGKAFSFVDHGVIKVQSLIKRSPQRIELNRPLHDITLLEWLDDDNFFLSAKERNRYGIYQINREGQVIPLILNPYADCLYPQKVGSWLFYIERVLVNGIQQHKIMQVEYKAISYPVDEDFEGYEPINSEVVEKERITIFGLLYEPICAKEVVIPAAFLRMVSLECGYYISYPSQIKRTEQLVNCDYFQLKKQENGEWTSLRLFSFKLPTNLLFVHTESRLYESILPLLPKQYGNHIYYNNVISDSFNLAVYSYDIVTGISTLVLSSSVAGQAYFVPIKINNTLFSGGHLVSGFGIDSSVLDNNVIPLYMECNETGVEVGLPII